MHFTRKIFPEIFVDVVCFDDGEYSPDTFLDNCLDLVDFQVYLPHD